MDSNIELNLNNIFNIDFYSLLGFFAMTSLVMAFFLVTSRLNMLICKSGLNKYVYIMFALLTALLIIPMFPREADHAPGYVYPVLLLVYLLTFLYFSAKSTEYRNISGVLIYIVLFSTITTFVLDFYHGVKERQKIKILAVELSSKRDPLMEYEFSRSKSQMEKDATLMDCWIKEKIIRKQMAK